MMRGFKVQRSTVSVSIFTSAITSKLVISYGSLLSRVYYVQVWNAQPAGCRKVGTCIKDCLYLIRTGKEVASVLGHGNILSRHSADKNVIMGSSIKKRKKHKLGLSSPKFILQSRIDTYVVNKSDSTGILSSIGGTGFRNTVSRNNNNSSGKLFYVIKQE